MISVFTNYTPDTRPAPAVKELELIETLEVPQYNVILLNDEEHTYDYVIEMLTEIFGMSAKHAFECACKVDSDGFVVVATTHKDRAELKRDQIESYGADWRMPVCSGSMSAIVEPAERLGM